jgi:hypothetical protein
MINWDHRLAQIIPALALALAAFITVLTFAAYLP